MAKGWGSVRGEERRERRREGIRKLMEIESWPLSSFYRVVAGPVGAMVEGTDC
jgi:hypothetical protein